MSKYCSDCVFLNQKDKKMDGIYVSTYATCDKFSENYSHWYGKSKLYDEGKNVNTNTTPTASYVVILIILSILYILGKLKGY